MQHTFELPIKKIGEPNWVEKLRAYLESLDVEVAGVPEETIAVQEQELNLKLPADIRAYYQHFGGTASHDFMYGLKPVQELQLLFAANLSFVSFNFKMFEINAMVFFAQSPANDPLCFDKDSGEIYLFSHDPIKKARVFADFNQYLLFELIEAEKLVGGGVPEEQEGELKSHYLSGEGIDYAFRDQEL